MAIPSESPRSGQESRSSAFGVPPFRDDPGAAYAAVRKATERLCEPLEIEDYGLQSMADASPVKWHIAHTTWFFETFVLGPYGAGYREFHPRFGYLFNSYYETVGRMHPRPQRGLLSRPTVAEVRRYRAHVDEHMQRWLASGAASDEQLAVVELGLHHEQQHQELILTDLKHGLSHNPLQPAYIPAPPSSGSSATPMSWREHGEGIVQIGYEGAGFHFDNETPRHREFVEPFAIATRLVTCGEYLEFMGDGGYSRADLWLSAGWGTVQERGWNAPLYWEQRDGQWWVFTLHGPQPVDHDEPVCHVSLFEADAYARWAGARLPTEFEWEAAFADAPAQGNFLESGRFHPRHATEGHLQVFGDAWGWTRSAYGPYPGYQPPAGALGEYNGKFMCSQLVLRGGSCATSASHVRPTYRNFFYPPDRWQFSGIRLAKEP